MDFGLQMKDRKVDKLVREAIERLHKDNAIFCENPSFCDGIRDRIREQIANMKWDNCPRYKVGNKGVFLTLTQ
jgi:hypothetical protein